MKELILAVFEKFGITSPRTRNIVKHIGWASLYKVGSVVLSFMLVPLTIDYLDNENYGIWLTLSSFVSWFAFLDIGLGQGLRNKFAEAKSLGNYEMARAYVSGAYFTIGIISIVAILLLLVANNFIDWTWVFNTSPDLQSSLKILIPVVFAFLGLQMIAKLIITIYTADQHHSIHIKIEFITRLLSILIIWLLLQTTQSSLLLFGIIFGSLPVLVLLGLNLIGFSTRYAAFKPGLNHWKKKYTKEITGVGLQFFIIQISTVVLFSTDNLIISKIFSAEHVVPYNIAFKYFSVIVMVYTIITYPYWSSITEAYTKGDIKWIKVSVKNIQKMWLLVPIALGVLIVLSDWFYNLWVGDKVEVSFGLSLAMALYALLITFNMIYASFINGVGKIRLQVYMSIFTMIINIPLSIFFAKFLELGLSGIMLATCVSLLMQAIIWPIQYYKVTNDRASGIWNK